MTANLTSINGEIHAFSTQVLDFLTAEFTKGAFSHWKAAVMDLSCRHYIAGVAIKASFIVLCCPCRSEKYDLFRTSWKIDPLAEGTYISLANGIDVWMN